MDYKSSTISKLDGILAQIFELRNREFPYKSSQIALELLSKYFKDEKDRIINISPSSKVLSNLCEQLVSDIDKYLPIIGLISNSSSVRNIFEAFDPMWELASNILEPSNTPQFAKIHLILSSEWSRFSPFVYSQLPFTNILPGFVLIGLPASESANPFLLPLAGHELGHVVWRKFSLEQRIKQIVAETIKAKLGQKGTGLISLLNHPKFMHLNSLALYQAEELFCDFLGLRLFGNSFIHALHYFLFPKNGPYRPIDYHYPPNEERLKVIKNYSAIHHIAFPKYAEKSLSVHSCVADDCTILCTIRRNLEQTLDSLIDEVLPKRLYLHSQEESDKIAIKFRIVVPATDVKSMADILNAGWKVYLELLDSSNKTEGRLKIEYLKDIMAKNLEIFTIERMTR